MFAELELELKTKVHTAALAAVWGSIAAVSVVSMLFFLFLGAFVWTSQHYDWVVASFVLMSRSSVPVLSASQRLIFWPKRAYRLLCLKRGGSDVK
ncbi:MAG TPA: hypothetical protein VET25_11945 [Aestuariivirgaceae bacterium]|nr:hypothetical protein [Aestuariivirgaceae bacterium]